MDGDERVVGGGGRGCAGVDGLYGRGEAEVSFGECGFGDAGEDGGVGGGDEEVFWG